MKTLNFQHQRSPRVIGYFFALLSIAAFSINGSVAKQVLTAGVHPIQLTQIRIISSAICLFVITFIFARKHLRIAKKKIFQLIFFGGIGITGTQMFYILAIDIIPIGLALILEFTAPLYVAFWVHFVQKETLKQRVWIATLLIFIGLFLVTQIWADTRLELKGVAFALISGLALALFYIGGRKFVQDSNSLGITTYSMIFAALPMAAVFFVQNFETSSLTIQTTFPGTTLSIKTYVLIVFIVLLGTVLPFSLTLLALRFLSAHTMSILGTLEPIGAGIIAWILLNQILSLAQLIGVAIILTGILLAETSHS